MRRARPALRLFDERRSVVALHPDAELARGAIAKVHGKNGFDFQKGGYELNLALMAIAGGLLLAGPGLISAHEATGRFVQHRRRQRFLRAIGLLK